MKIYFGASITFDRSMLPQYQMIVAKLKEMGHEIVSEYVVDPELETGDGLDADDLFSREVSHIELADVMVAEVSRPSWGTAFLMEHALSCGKPVLALFYAESEESIPMMIAGHPQLYEQHYDEANLGVVLEKSLMHFEVALQRKGKLIVIDGGDGSGKATQTKMLFEYFASHQMKANLISFPRYKTSFHGKHVGRFLTGEFGGNNEVSPYLSSLAYALDRLTARDQILAWLKQGHMVVADRYVSASMAHQGSKLTGKKQEAYLQWLYEMEYKEHRLPKEDVVLFLYVPVKTAQKLLLSSGGKGEVNGKDIAEIDIEHQKKSIQMYTKLARNYSHWEMIRCVDDSGNLLSREQVHLKILTVLQKHGIIDNI